MKQILNSIPLVCALAIVLSSCASIDKEKFAKIDRVAIIGFDVTQQRPIQKSDIAKSLLGNLDSPKAELKLATVSPHVAPMIETFENQMKTQKKWTVLSQADLKKSPTYQAVLKKKTEGFSTRPQMNERFDIYRSETSMDYFAGLMIDKDDLKKIAQELRVDTLAIVSSKILLNNNSTFMSLIGKGEFKPLSEFSFSLFDGATGDKFMTKSRQGEPVAGDLKNTLGVTDESKLLQLAQLATKSAGEDLLKELP